MKDFNPNHIENQDTRQDFVSTPNVVRTDKTLVVKDFFVANDAEVRMLRGQTIARRAMFGNYTLTVTDFLVGYTSLAITPSVGLPRPSQVGAGKSFIIKDEIGGAATTTITVRSEGEKLIDGSATSTLTTNYQTRRYYTDGANWYTY